MKGVVEKTFLQALLSIQNDPRMTKLYLEDKRLTKAEKEIVKCWLLLRENQSQEIFQILEKMTDSQSALVLSQKYLIWGLALNNHGHFQASVEKIERALEDLDKFQLPEHLFIACYNLFIANYNLQAIQGMENSLVLLSRLPAVETGHKISLWQCQLLLALAKGDHQSAQASIEKLEAERSHMSEPVVISYLVSKFRFEISRDDYAAAIETMGQMKKHRKFSLTGNYQYMKSLLDFVLEDAPLYVYKKNFESCLYLYWQLRVIESLQRGEVSEAKNHWDELQAIHPQVYHAYFDYTGEKSLFSLALERVKHSAIRNQLPNEPQTFSSKEEHLLSLLRKASGPLTSAVLVKAIWAVEEVEFAHYDKLKKLVSRVRQKHGVDIQYKKGCYFMNESKKLSKSS